MTTLRKKIENAIFKNNNAISNISEMSEEIVDTEIEKEEEIIDTEIEKEEVVDNEIEKEEVVDTEIEKEEVLLNKYILVETDEENYVTSWKFVESQNKTTNMVNIPEDSFFFEVSSQYESSEEGPDYGYRYYKLENGQLTLDSNYTLVPSNKGILSYKNENFYLNKNKLMYTDNDIILTEDEFQKQSGFYYIGDADSIKLNVNEYSIFLIDDHINNLRNIRNNHLLPAFDLWEKAVLRGREEDSKEIMDWYKDLLDLKEEAINTIPERVSYYIK